MQVSPQPLLLAGLMAGCSSGPSYHVMAGVDHVYANEEAIAADVAKRTLLGRALIETQVPDSQGAGVEIWVLSRATVAVDQGPIALHDAFTVHAPGKPARVYVGPHSYEYQLQHELVHALLGESWEPLPLAIEEGLCSFLNEEMASAQITLVHLRCAGRVEGSGMHSVSLLVQGAEGEPVERSMSWGYNGGTYSIDSALTLDQILSVAKSSELGSMTADEVGHIYGVGLVLVRRIADLHGIEGLHQLCTRATAEGLTQIPSTWVLEAAQIDDLQQLERLAMAQLRSLSSASAFEDAFFLEFMRVVRRDTGLPADASAEEFLARIEGTVVINGERAKLDETDEFRAWLGAAWGPPLSTGASE